MIINQYPDTWNVPGSNAYQALMVRIRFAIMGPVTWDEILKAASGPAVTAIIGVIGAALCPESAGAGCAAAVGAIAGAAGSCASNCSNIASIGLSAAIGAAVGGATGALGKTGCSFAPETQVVMADGTTKRIDRIRPGDRVKTHGTVDGKTTDQVVTVVSVNHDHDLFDIEIDIDGKTSTLHATQNHRIWSASKHQWVEAKSLRDGEQLKTLSGLKATVVGLSSVPNSGDMWDLTVASTHDFYVAIAGGQVLVHNNCGDLGPDWTQRPAAEIPGSFGCEACAADIITRLGGGQLVTVTPTSTPLLPAYRGQDPGWASHTAVLFNGRVYDAFGPGTGVPVDQWRELWGAGATFTGLS